jgi:PBSX family phage terminase large subunit
MSPMVVASETKTTLTYTHYGAASDLFWYRSKEILMGGPAGTGKSRACLEKLHACAQHYPGMRGLMVRKTLVSLVGAGIVTYKAKVLHPLDGVRFFGGSKDEPASYRYPNGSRIVIGGLDKSEKVMSTEYDMIYVQEATETTEQDWEDLTTRLRNHVMPYQQLMADCNPQQPTHWLKLRCDRGQTRMLYSRHEDNPTVTEEYLNTLRALTGVRRARLYEGIWAAAEGIVYDEYDERIHLVDAAPAGLRNVFAAQDWGYTNPGVLGVFGEDGDGRLFLVAELYMTGQTVDKWWVPRVVALHKQYRFQSIQCDPSEPAYIQQYVSAGLPAVKGINAIAPGVGVVRTRLTDRRVFFVRDALRERDEALVAAHLPFVDDGRSSLATCGRRMSRGVS